MLRMLAASNRVQPQFSIATIGWAIHMPLIFASLGPTAYEIVEKPNSKSARVYNVIVGHFVALGSGFFRCGSWLRGTPRKLVRLVLFLLHESGRRF
jgi:hypothetical protein